MKFAIPEISWHNRDPVLSVHFQNKSDGKEPLRLATGGTDSHVLIWYISTTETGSVNLEVAADLCRHQKAVNVVRWSPNGEFLASGDDESIIFIWKQKTENEITPNADLMEEQYKETWVIHKTLRGHMEDVLDISWSPDSSQLASGSVDNKLLIWDLGKGKYSTILSDHKGFVQGVSWDPMGQFIASASTDRVFRTFEIATKKVTSRSSKAILPFPDDHPFHDVKVRLYHDDTLQTYFRRLAFSPDGLLIAVPAGRIEPEQGKIDMKPINAVYIYTRYSLSIPVCILPCNEAALVTSWSPRRYALRSDGPKPSFPVEWRMLLAVATKRSVILYDTQQKSPIAIISNIHYTRLTDLTWSPDGRILVASSTDGFCSVIMFGADELGEVLPDTPQKSTNEPMDVETEREEVNESTVTVKESPEENKFSNNVTKIDSYIKFKTPQEKSPKKSKIDKKQQKTPVKYDILEDTALPSWSDNSNTEIINPQENTVRSDKPVESKETEIIEIEDSEDMKLVYDEGTQSQSPARVPEKTDSKCTASSESAKTSPTSSPKKGPPKTTQEGIKISSPFMKKAKVMDMKDPVAVKSLPSPKAPRRVSFVTLSSPKNKKS